MKTTYITTTIITLSLAVFVAMGFSSCKKEDHDHDGEGHVHVYFQNKMGSMDLMYNHAHDLNGRSYEISTLQYYVSNVRLTKDDGTEYVIDGIYEVVKGGTALELELEGIPAGHYHGIKFYVGLDSTTNHADPSTYAAGDPLAEQVPDMHWSWATGYIFMRFEGKVDTTAAASGSANINFEMHLGGDGNKNDISLTKHFEAGPDEHPSITINMDAEDLLGGSIDLTDPNDLVTHGHDNMALGMKLKANIATAFSVE